MGILFEQNSKNNRIPDLALGLGLTFIALAFFGHFTFGRLPVSTDMSLMYAPFYSLKWDGGLPLWNPAIAGGMAMDGNLQFSAAYPLRWPFYFIDDWRSWFSTYMFIHYAIALAGTAGALRSIGVSRLGTFVGAIVFVCGGYMVGRIINTTIFMASCWLPWMIWGAIGPKRYAGLIAALGIGMVILVGSPHVMVYGSIGFAVAWIIMTPWRKGSGQGMSATRGAVKERLLRWVYFALGIGAGLVSLLPGMNQVRRSVRTETDIANNLGDSLRWEEVPFSLFGGLGNVNVPEINDKCVYIGGVVFLLIVFGAFRPGIWRDRKWWCGVALTLAGAALALGDSIGWQYVLPYLPGLNLLEGPARALVLTAFGLAMLAALSIDGIGEIGTRHRRAVGVVASVVAAVLGGAFLAGYVEQGVLGGLLFGWLTVPGTAVGRTFPALDVPITLALASLMLLLWPAKVRGLPWAFTLLLILQLGHFAPRVAPRTVERDYFDAPPGVRFLMAQDASEPFRIAGFDALRYNDGEWDNQYKNDYLMTNLATLYGLEDIRAFDPLTSREYKRLLIDAVGQPPYNDPIRNLDLGRPDAELFRTLNVRFLIGHPYDRRLTNLPQSLTSANPKVEVDAWRTAAEEKPIVAWHMVSLIDTAEAIELGDPVANLVIHAEEGAFRFPVRYGIETAHVADRPEKVASLPVRPDIVWRNYGGTRGEKFRRWQTKYRATIEFGQALRVRRVEWELLRPDALLFIPAQAYRLASPDEDEEWRLAFESEVAPVYEFLQAGSRAVLIDEFVREGDGVIVTDSEPARARIELTNRSARRLKYEIETDDGGLLYLKEKWAPGWRASVDGERVEVLRVNGLFRGVEVTAGQHTIDMWYAPRLFYIAAALSVLSVLLAIGLYAIQRRRVIEMSEQRE